MTRNKLITGALMTLMLACGGCPFDGGWGCGSTDPNQTEASLYVTNANDGEAISYPTIKEGDATLYANCGESDPGLLPLVCTSQVLQLPAGPHDLTVSAEGFRTTTVHIDTTTDRSAHLAVALTPAPADREIDPAGNTVSANP